MLMPRTIKETTLGTEVRSMIEEAKALPADGVLYVSNDIKMVHRPATKMKVEQVLANRYGQTWRSMNTNKGWTRVDEIGGQL
jgi:hypothetical protein